jgi:hypothetical protein
VTRAAAAAPNRSTIGGAGTSIPLLVDELVELELDVLLEVELELDVLLEVAPLLVLVELPKLDEEVLVEAVKIALLLLPPKKAPLKKPPAKARPPPPPRAAAAAAAGAPPLLATAIGGSGGRAGG